jgi:SseB protein N-terminal domain
VDIVAMTAEEFVPRNTLEHLLIDARAGRISAREMAVGLVSSDIAVPSSEVNGERGRFNPIILGKAGVQLVAAFTDRDRAKSLPAPGSFVMVMKGSELLELLPAGFGIVINPELQVSCEISPTGVEEMRRDLCQGKSQFIPSRLAAFLRRLLSASRVVR